VRYPVHITRERQWEGEVRLRADAEIGEQFVYVPGGPFISGEGKKAEAKESADFAIAEFPVTNREYSAFLDSLDADEADKRCPRSVVTGPLMARGPAGRFHPTDKNIRGRARVRCKRDHGPDFEWDLPVLGISWHDANAYCKWRTETTGVTWRLPTWEERQKAARGVDGRLFPWGDLDDSSLANCIDSRQESSQPEPVGAFPTATSVYGMGDACGNVFEWTGSWYRRGRSSPLGCGGSWANEMSFLRCSNPLVGATPRYRETWIGFRCVRDLPTD
jgi:serine/threonine-protein kinase